MWLGLLFAFLLRTANSLNAIESKCLRQSLLINAGVNHIRISYPSKTSLYRKCRLFSVPRPSGYLPPELDPEFNKNAPRSFSNKSHNVPSQVTYSTVANPYASLPTPSEGDIVLYFGKFGAKQVGRIRFLQYVQAYDAFYADIIPLRESKTMGIYVVDRNAKAEYLSLTDLKPVKSSFLRNEDGYKLFFHGTNTTITTTNKIEKEVRGDTSLENVSLRADGYRVLDRGYQSRKRPVDFVRLDGDLKDYDDLKARIVALALQIGAVLSVLAGVRFGVDLAVPYSFGVVAGVIYFFLLSTKVESIGSRYSARHLQPIANSAATIETEIIDGNTNNIAPKQLATATELFANPIFDTLSNFRFLVPVFLLGILSEKDVLFNQYQRRDFHFLPQNEFIAAMAGFLTLRVSIFLSEVVKEIRGEDLAGLVPGSLAILVRKVLFGNKENEESLTDKDQEAVVIPKRVVLFTGPVAAGRYELMQKLFVPSATSQQSASGLGSIPVSREDYNDQVVFTYIPTASLTTNNISTFAELRNEHEKSKKQEQLRLEMKLQRDQYISEWQDKQSRLGLPLLSPTEIEQRLANTIQNYKGEQYGSMPLPSMIVYDGLERNIWTGERVEFVLPRAVVAPQIFKNTKEYRVWRKDRQLELRQQRERQSTAGSSKEEVVVLCGPPSLHAALVADDCIDLTTIWISLQSKEQFISKATSIVQQQVLYKSKVAEQYRESESKDQNIAKDAAEVITDLVNEAAQDISYFMSNAPLFDFTILNTEEEEKNTEEEIKLLLKNVKSSF